ncbi:MAG: hypothetical protein QM758_28675 [Armatimonas sp.]
MKLSRRWGILATGLSLISISLIGCGGGDGTIDPDPTPTPTPTPTPGGGSSYRLKSLVPDALMTKNTKANAINADGTLQGGVSYTTTADPHALVWNSSPNVMVDMGPGEVRALEADVQIGFTGTESMPSERAVLWRGSEASRVELHPAGYSSSHAVGGDATIQVGRARTIAGDSHAMLWRGTAASAVDLHSAAYSLTRAYGGNATTQVGNGRLNSVEHALLWHGTPESLVDMGPGIAWAVSGDTQVGQGVVSGGMTHALLWKGTEASKVDLHPAGFQQSRAFGVAGNRQVGYADTASSTHAIVWSGTAASAVDLHQFTQSFLINGAPPAHSYASGIDNNGNVVGSVRGTNGLDYAVIWERI